MFQNILYDDFLAVSYCGKLSSKFLSGTSRVIEKVVLFDFSLGQLLDFVLSLQLKRL